MKQRTHIIFLQLPTQVTISKSVFSNIAPFEFVSWWLMQVGVKETEWIFLRTAVGVSQNNQSIIMASI